MDVLWILDGGTLAVLRRALQPITATKGPHKRPRITLEEFVAEFYRAVCLRHGADHGSIGRSQSETRQLVERMCILFDLVDVDSLGVVDWEHFTDFCVYMRGRDSGNQGLEVDEPGAATGVGEGQEGGITRFVEKLGYTDRSSHCHEIRSMRFVKRLELMVVVEGTAILKIYTPGPLKVRQIEPAIAMRKLIIDTKRSTRIAGPKGKSRGAANRAASALPPANGTEESMAVLAMDFIGRDNQAAVSCADGYLTVWDLETCKLLRHTRLRDVQVGLRFCRSMDVLTSWGVDEFNHEIIVWDVDKLTVLHVLDGHCEPVKDICEVAPPPLTGNSESAEKPWDPILVTAGMDHKVVLWNLRLEKAERNFAPKKLFVLLGHYHGVLSLAYSSEHDLILSAGFDFDASCWDRSTSHLHMKLVGHRHSLIGVVIVEHETQRAVTGDESGAFRVWDIQRGHSDHGTCLQSFSLRNTRVSPRSMAVVWKEGLIVAGSKMHVFRAVPTPKAEASPLGAWFSSYTGELCIVLREAVWFDAATGNPKRRTFGPTHGREITAFCMDARHKKAVVGDQRGGLRVYDGVTGRWVMSANPHRSEVSALLFVEEDNAFISAGWDGMIQVHDARIRSFSATRWKANPRQEEGEQEPVGHRCAFTVRSVVNAHDGDITLMGASARLGLIATASSDLTVRLWDYGLLRLEEVIVAHRQEITCVRFLDPLPCLATADMTGKVLIWATRPHPKGGALLLMIRNTVITAGNTAPKATGGGGGERRARQVLPTPVTCIAFRHHTAADSDDADIAAARSATKKQVAANRKESTSVAGCGEKEELVGQAPPPLPGKGGGTPPITEINIPTTATPWEVGSILFTGDELGSIKVWDLTAVLLDKLGPAACGVGGTEDKAAVPPSSFGAASHHFVHYRQGPLDGVGLHAAMRFRELIDIGRVLRRGDHLQSEKPEPDGSRDDRLRRAGLDEESGSVRGGRVRNRRPPPAEAKSSADSSSLSAGSTTGRSHDRSPTTRSKQGLLLGVNRKPRVRGAKGASNPSLSSSLSSRSVSDACDSQRRPAGPKEQAEATLNARPDDIDPVFSWKGHDDSITSMQIVSTPPCVLTGSLDSSARLFSFGGVLLGVMAERKNVAGAAARPWRFEPPPNGRNAEASARAMALEQRLKTVRQEERQPVPAAVGGGGPRNSEPPTNRCGDLSSPPSNAPANGSVLGATSTASERGPTGPRREARTDRMSPSPSETLSKAPTETGRTAAVAVETKDLLRTQSAISAVCLSRIAELTQMRVATTVATESDARSDSLQAAEENIEERLLSEAQEGWKNQLRAGVGQSRLPSAASKEGRHGYHHNARHTRGDSEPPLSPAQKDIETVEGPRVTGRTVRSGGRPFTCPGPRRKGITEKDGVGEGEGEVNGGGRISGQAEKRQGMPLTQRSAVPLTQRSTPNLLPTQRSVLNLASARSNISNRSNLSIRPTVSTKAAVAKRMAADRRRRRMDYILDGVRRMGQREGMVAQLPISSPRAGEEDEEEEEKKKQTKGEWGTAGGEGRGTGTVVISTRVQEVLSRFERSVNDDGDSRDSGPDDEADQKVRAMRRQLDARIAARQEAIRHNERYRRAQRYDLVTLQETQQRRHEAMVGLTGPSGERFGPYSLDDVLEFQVFANHLNAQGAEHLTVRGLVENPDIQADPYSHALLQELARSRVLQWNRPLSLEDLMQLVFHFAKHDEAKRMVAVMDIVVLLERLRDAFLADKDSLVGKNESLPLHFMNDIDMAFRATSAEACGTCTMKELHGVMTRVGSDLFSCGQEELDRLAAQCGVVDGHKELTADDFTAIIAKLVSLHTTNTKAAGTHTRETKVM
ncbi:unnamed protein product [Ectocarpus fasciculatus]